MVVCVTGSQYFKLTDDAIAPGYPRSISANWGGMPGSIDAAFTWINGKTYFLKVILTQLTQFNSSHLYLTCFTEKIEKNAIISFVLYR